MNTKHIHSDVSARRIAKWQLTRALAGSLCLVALAPGDAAGAQVTVEGTFTSFTTWMFAPSERVAYVNGLALTSSAAIVGSNGAIDYFRSDPVHFSGTTTRIDFVYDAAGFTPPAPLLNSMQFIANPAPVDVGLGVSFPLGTFRFTNGQWYPEADFGFRLTTQSADPALNGHVFEGTIHLTSVSAIPHFIDPLLDAQVEADYFFLVEQPGLGSARVYDLIRQPPGNPGNVGDFALNGYISSIHPTAWAALNAGGFTDASIETALAVPEPRTYLLVGMGLGLVVWRLRRERRAVSSGEAAPPGLRP